MSEATTTIGFFKMACDRRNAERERCYNIVYQALSGAEDEAVIDALKSIAIQIVDPRP